MGSLFLCLQVINSVIILNNNYDVSGGKTIKVCLPIL